MNKVTSLFMTSQSNEQSHDDDGHANIAGGFELIPGHVAQSARLDGQRSAQHEFNAETRDAGQGTPRIISLKPRGC
jgi:hypothetical protein